MFGLGQFFHKTYEYWLDWVINMFVISSSMSSQQQRNYSKQCTLNLGRAPKMVLSLLVFLLFLPTRWSKLGSLLRIGFWKRTSTSDNNGLELRLSIRPFVSSLPQSSSANTEGGCTGGAIYITASLLSSSLCFQSNIQNII